MASGLLFRCSTCSHEVQAWDEGDPYVLEPDGTKRYVYHPDPEREKAVGNDAPVLCLGCGAAASSDSRAPLTRCPTCDAERFVDLWDLEGAPCPYCREGTFAVDPDFRMIS